MARLLLLWALWILGSVSTVWTAERVKSHAFESEVAEFESKDQAHRPPSKPVVFVGSSSFRNWKRLEEEFASWRALNRGFGGSTMGDLLHFKERLVRRYQPRAVVVYEGDNDLNQGQTPEEVLAHYQRFLHWMQEELPGTPVLLLAVKPSPRRIRQLEAQRQLNAQLLQLATERPGVFFVDTATPLLTPSGEPDARWFLQDQLHLNEDGYRQWIPVVRGALARAISKP